MAQRFLHMLAPDGTVTFQTFDDRKPVRPNLAHKRHGSFEQHADEMTDLNQGGAGVFVTVNETDGKGRAATNIVRVRATFVDLDGAPLEPVTRHRIPPDIVVESSPGRWHAYWLTDDCPLAEFKTAQQRLARQFNGDQSVCDLPRVMRLPGFLHQKGKPFMTKIIFPS
ncbi:MAG: DNA-primase RepB domain-containing protein [Candidatus Accumulibacter sp. UW20]